MSVALGIKNEKYIVCKDVLFYSMLDEDIFFEWIARISCIKSYKGIKNELYVFLIDKDLTYHDMKDLIAILRRYKINMKQLAKFVNKQNESALIPWSKEIFGASKKFP